MCALALQLPAEAAVWRDQAWPADVDVAVTTLEHLDGWGRAIVMAQLGHKSVELPPPAAYVRPGEEQVERQRREQLRPSRQRDKIASFFGKLAGRDG